jgi:hypothetical protein
MLRALRHFLPATLCVLLPLLDLLWNLTHLNVGLPDFYGLALPARALALHGAWPQTPYFPALYPVLLVPFGLAGSVLAGGYVLSCCGLMLALFAVRRLFLVLAARSSNPALLASLVVLLAWLMPIWRVVAGSPSVDALYTGLGLWYLTAAVAAWRLTASRQAVQPAGAGGPAPSGPASNSQSAQPGPAASGSRPWPHAMPLVVILWATALVLPLLRYHAVILVVPIAAVLLTRIRGRWTALSILKAGLLAVVFNYLGYIIANGEPLPGVAALQVRCGIEFEQHIHYPTAQALWDDYANFAEHGRSTSLLADYSAGQLAAHIVRNLGMFLRQPAIVLALLGLVGVLLLRRRNPSLAMPAGTALLGLWILLYCLSLSPAYYTARAALLPALAGLALSTSLMQYLSRPWQSVGLGLLVIGYGLGSSFALQDLAARSAAARLGSDALKASDNPLIHDSVGNPWCLPFNAGPPGSWLDDPAIPPDLREGWQVYDEEE